MENHRVVAAAIALGILISPGAAVAYSRDTHKGISEVIIRAYEQRAGDNFSPQQEAVFIQGSWDEDDDWRFMRHFYDPINNTGLRGEYSSSKYWAQDTLAQANYECVGAWICYGENVAYTDKYFSSETDFSWDRAVYEYAWGDGVRGAAALGHVIHLIQDVTVPAHVRDDSHPSKWGITSFEDPYEKYSSRFAQGNTEVPPEITITSFSSLGYVFDEVARFTNINFVSKDTLTGSYDLPNLAELRYVQGFAVNTLGHKVARAEQDTAFSGGNRTTRFYIDDDNDTVAADYWRVLSKKAIESGVGVIDLFFREVEKEKKTGVLKAKNVSAAELRAKENAKKGFGLVKKLYGSSLSQSDVEELLDEGGGQVGAAALALSDPRGVEHTEVKPEAVSPVVAPKPKPTTEPHVKSLGLSREESGESFIEIPNPESLETAPIVPQQGISPGFGGGGPVPSPSLPVVPGPVVITLSITSPVDSIVLSTTSVVFSGVALNGRLVELAYGSATTSAIVDNLGNWSATIDLPEGSTQIIFTATDSLGSQPAVVTRTMHVDLTPTDTPVLSAAACTRSLSASFCLIATTTATIIWDDVPGASYYSVVHDSIAFATSTATTSSVSVGTSATTSVAVVAYDAAGNAATSSSIFLYAAAQPLIINEVGWGGTDTVSDQWIEIKNVSPYTLDLSHIVVARAAGSIALSSTLAANTILIVEQTSAPFSGLNKIVTSFSSLSTTSGEELSLAWDDGSASTIIDKTPAAGVCAGWCAGELLAQLGSNQSGLPNLYSPLSMERKVAASDGSLASSWQSTDSYGAWLGGGTLWGTAGGENSRGLPASGVYCGSSANLVVANASFDPGDGSCAYLSRFITGSTFGVSRFGALYRGTVGSSTQLTGHTFGKALATAVSESIPTPTVGEQFFFVIWEHRSGPAFDDDSTLFDLYFESSALSGATVTSPPPSTYVVLPWTYSP